MSTKNTGPNKFTQGFAVAIAQLIKLHGEDTMAIDIMRCCGYSLADFIRDGVDEYDLQQIRPAWIGIHGEESAHA